MNDNEPTPRPRSPESVVPDDGNSAFDSEAQWLESTPAERVEALAAVGGCWAPADPATSITAHAKADGRTPLRRTDPKSQTALPQLRRPLVSQREEIMVRLPPWPAEQTSAAWGAHGS